MALIKLHNNIIHTVGELPKIGEKAPNFSLTYLDLSKKNLNDFKGYKIILNIFPSVDTGICATSVRTFNKKASELPNTKILCISKDLPFAQERFCGAEGIKNVLMLSDFQTGNFGKKYGVEISDSPMAGLLSRCIVVINEYGIIKYTEQVNEIASEPNYKEALKFL